MLLVQQRAVWQFQGVLCGHIPLIFVEAVFRVCICKIDVPRGLRLTIFTKGTFGSMTFTYSPPKIGKNFKKSAYLNSRSANVMESWFFKKTNAVRYYWLGMQSCANAACWFEQKIWSPAGYSQILGFSHFAQKITWIQEPIDLFYVANILLPNSHSLNHHGHISGIPDMVDCIPTLWDAQLNSITPRQTDMAFTYRNKTSKNIN